MDSRSAYDMLGNNSLISSNQNNAWAKIMGICASYLYKLLQGLSVQAWVVLQEPELLQLELVPKVTFCLHLQQLEHCSTQEEVKEIPHQQEGSPTDPLAVYGEEGHAATLLLPAPAQYL